MAKITPVDKLADTIDQILNEYADNIWAITQETIDTLGKEGAKAVRANAKQKLDHPHGYPKGWKYTADKSKGRRREKTGVIHNATEYQLAHLLEFSHPMRNGTGRTFGSSKARPHIAEVEQMIVEKLENELVRAIK